MDLTHLYNKKILSHGGFRVYRLLLDIQNESGRPTVIKASRPILMKLTGLSENSLKSAIDEILLLRLVSIQSERPTMWRVNERDKFNETELMMRIQNLSNPADTADQAAHSES